MAKTILLSSYQGHMADTKSRIAQTEMNHFFYEKSVFFGSSCQKFQLGYTYCRYRNCNFEKNKNEKVVLGKTFQTENKEERSSNKNGNEEETILETMTMNICGVFVDSRELYQIYDAISSYNRNCRENITNCESIEMYTHIVA